MCIVTRESHPKERLIRFVRGPEHQIVADVDGRLPGRGVWVTARRPVVDEAVRRKAFSRALRETVSVPPELGEQVGEMLVSRALQLLSFGRKAGLLRTGHDTVTRLVETGRAAIVIHAADAAPDGVEKIAAKIRTADRRPEVVQAFTREQLSLALGRPNVVHAAMIRSRLADAFLSAAQRFADYGRTEDT